MLLGGLQLDVKLHLVPLPDNFTSGFVYFPRFLFIALLVINLQLLVKLVLPILSFISCANLCRA